MENEFDLNALRSLIDGAMSEDQIIQTVSAVIPAAKLNMEQALILKNAVGLSAEESTTRGLVYVTATFTYLSLVLVQKMSLRDK